MRRYGFNAGLTAPGNLSKGYDSLSQDFPTIVWRLRQLGFNAVRLPFSFQVDGCCWALPCMHSCVWITP